MLLITLCKNLVLKGSCSLLKLWYLKRKMVIRWLDNPSCKNYCLNCIHSTQAMNWSYRISPTLSKLCNWDTLALEEWLSSEMLWFMLILNSPQTKFLKILPLTSPLSLIKMESKFHHSLMENLPNKHKTSGTIISAAPKVFTQCIWVLTLKLL